MDIHTLKQEIRDSDKVEELLESLNMHNVCKKGNYWACGMPDGDNPSSTIIYDNELLTTVAYTRVISKNIKQPSDIFTLIMFVKDISFPQSINYVCEFLGIGYYDDLTENIPKSLLLLKEIEEMSEDSEEQEDKYKNKVRNKRLLNCYSKNVNELFKNDGISYKTQLKFNIGFDDDTNRITIPIFNELDELVGVKGRIIKESKTNADKYLYLEKCNKSQILYGFNINYDKIMEKQSVFVGEAEKFVLQLYSKGIYNAVSLGGHKVSSYQRILLERLCVPICLCLDKDISREEVELECSKFSPWSNVYYMYDDENILEEKQSPSDDINKFNILKERHIYKYVSDKNEI